MRFAFYDVRIAFSDIVFNFQQGVSDEKRARIATNPFFPACLEVLRNMSCVLILI